MEHKHSNMEITPELEKRIRDYNEDLRNTKEESADLKARVEYGEKTLKSQCEKLSSLLGKEVTEENLQQIYQNELSRILNDLEVGERILQRIKNNEIEDETVQDDTKVMADIAQSKQSVEIDRVSSVAEEEIIRHQTVPESNSVKANEIVEEYVVVQPTVERREEVPVATATTQLPVGRKVLEI